MALPLTAVHSQRSDRQSRHSTCGVQRSDSDRGFLYSPVVSENAAKKSALSEIVRVFFNGSPASAASALLGMSDKLKDKDLDELEQMIARARRAKGGK